jgi:hypothetical protein
MSKGEAKAMRPSVPWLSARTTLDGCGRARPAVRPGTRCGPAARGGEYYGPGGWLELKGYPHRVGSSTRSHDERAQRALWQESERRTGVRYAGI